MRSFGLVTPFAAAADEPVPVEHGMHGANGWELNVALAAPHLLANLRCAPTRVLAFNADNDALDLQRQLIRVSKRPSARGRCTATRAASATH
jgi:hypothetical protein